MNLTTYTNESEYTLFRKLTQNTQYRSFPKNQTGEIQ